MGKRMNERKTETDYYAVLQVHDRALPEVVDKVYRLLARKYHPDVHPAAKKSWAEGRMTQLNIAYQVISDPGRRAEYDYRRRYGPDRAHRAAPADAAEPDRTLKCFNHPKRSSVAFCWHCGRPVCAECLAGEHGGRTTCVTCADLIEQEARWRVGNDFDPTVPPDLDDDAAPVRPGRRMGSTGVLLYYAFLVSLLAVIGWAVYLVAIAFANSQHQATGLVLGLALVMVVLLIQRLTWRAICPRCSTTVSHPILRANAPWSEFLAPQPICPRCGRRFRSSELSGSE